MNTWLVEEIPDESGIISEHEVAYAFQLIIE